MAISDDSEDSYRVDKTSRNIWKGRKQRGIEELLAYRMFDPVI